MFPDEALLNILKSFGVAGGYNMHLVQALPALTDENMTLAALTAAHIECDYPGYAAQTVAFGTPGIVTPDDGLMTSGTMTFQPSGMTVPQTIYGYYLTFPVYSLGALLFMWVRLSTPVVLVSDASQFQRIINLYDANFSPP